MPSAALGTRGSPRGGFLPSPHFPHPISPFPPLPSSGLISPSTPQAQGPHLGRQQIVELGGEIELDALPGSWEGDSSDQQHEQDEVGERGCEIHHLRDDKRRQKAGVTSTLRLFQKSPSYYLASPLLGNPSREQPSSMMLLFPSLHTLIPPAKSCHCFPGLSQIHLHCGLVRASITPCLKVKSAPHVHLPPANPPYMVISQHGHQTLDIPKFPSALSLLVPKPPATRSADIIKSQAPYCLGLHRTSLFLNGSYPGFLVFLLMVLFKQTTLLSILQRDRFNLTSD